MNLIKNRYCVYAHITKDTNELFYIGEGIEKTRPYSTRNRNRYWNFKVKKHGFVVKIIRSGLTKEEAENIESKIIIICKKLKINIVNFCVGPMIKNHWIKNATPDQYPNKGRKNPKLSEIVRARNLGKYGKDSNVYGLKRPDLSKRNKEGNFNRFSRKIICIETGQIFESIKSANNFFGKNYNIIRAIKENKTAGGYHWAYLENRPIK